MALSHLLPLLSFYCEGDPGTGANTRANTEPILQFQGVVKICVVSVPRDSILAPKV